MNAVADKICSLNELGKRAEEVRKSGKTVGLCHGVFDVLHIGHIKHFEAAKNECDVLFVTITADEFVRKGPDRPYFSSAMRMQMLASMEVIGGVSVVNEPSAIPAIEAVQPSVYFKGQDYLNANEDITGKIDTERATVEKYDGRLHHTKEITYSSSNLINNFFADYNPALRKCLRQMRENNGKDTLKSLIEKISGLNILIIGDAIIDEYQFVSALGKPSKENIIATLSQGTEQYAGSVFAVANHLSSFSKSTEIITTLGEKNTFHDLIKERLDPSVTLNEIIVSGRPTTRKTRFVDKGYTRKLFEVYDMDDTPLPESVQRELDEKIAERAREADVTIVCDFGHGMIAPSTVEVLKKEAKFLAVNVQTNAGNQGFNHITKFDRADFICIDAPEARAAVAEKFEPIEDILNHTLPSRLACPYMIVTHGIYGCYVHQEGQGVTHIPAFTSSVVDTVGAGDAFFAIAAPLAALGATSEEIGFIANTAGALKVGVVGHRKPIDRISVIKYITALLS